jgi:arginine N-succinyltransferase
MKFLRQIDPFDGGPYYGANTAELIPVASTSTYPVNPGEPAPERTRQYLVGHEQDGFRAVRAEIELTPQGQIIARPAVLRALGVEFRTRVDVVPLP